MPVLSVACSLCLSGSRAVGFGRLEGGREALLRGLEAMLGVMPPDVSRAERIAAYALALDAAAVAAWKTSLSADRWGTAEYLLERRDELRLAGWDGTGGIDLLTGPAAVEAAFSRAAALGGEADRVLRIEMLLSVGRPLPTHEVILDEPQDAWPRVWQPVLARLSCRDAPASEPKGRPGTTLLALQHGVVADLPALPPDGSFAVRTGASIQSSVQAIVAAIVVAPDKLAQTAIIGWDPTLTAPLDAQLRRLGFPTCGAPAAGSAVSVAQVLPLAVGLLWKPADPRLLIDLLSLPVGPISRNAGQRLAKALAEMPGLGSRAWERVFTELVDPSADPTGELRERLATWLEHDRVDLGKPIPTKLIDERCAVVAAWARGRSLIELEQGLRTSLQHVAAAATLLRRVIAVDAAPITQPQLVRLLAAVNAHDVAESPLPEEAGGPLLLPGWHALRVPIERAIWLGVSAQELARPRWSPGEIAALDEQGLRLDDASRLAALRRDADRRGLARVNSSLAIVLPPEPPERRPHPFWTAIRAKLPNPKMIPSFDAAGSTPWSAWTTAQREAAFAPHQPKRTLWTASAQLLKDRDRHSYTSLSKRLACPLAWTLEYVAMLYPGPIARLPDPFMLRGTFAHAVLAQALNGPIQSPATAAAAAKRLFEERVALDAAPLLFPGARGTTDDLCAAVATAAAVITRTLATAGCDRIETEHMFAGSKAGWNIEGSIDILGLGPKNRRIILDLKLGSLRDRIESLVEGRALQLAIYSATPEVTATGVGYWILNQRQLVTTDADLVPVAAEDSTHSRVISGAPAMAAVWS